MRALLAVIFVLNGWLFSAGPAAPAQSVSAMEVVTRINQLRAEYGLSPYTVNQTLMAVAQAHAEYQASTNTLTHYSSDGSRPRDRALAAGYGTADGMFMHENIYVGDGATPADAVGWWRTSDLHLQGMTQTGEREIGTGVAVSAGGQVFYVAMFGLRTSTTSAPAESSEPAAPPPSQGSSPPNPASIVTPVQVSAPGDDGAIWHEVQTGQAVWHIAEAYGMDVYDLLALNGLTEQNAVIYPDDLLLIQPAATPEPAENDPASSVQPTQTAIPPTETPSPGPTVTPELSLAAPTPEPEPDSTDQGFDWQKWLRVGAVVIGVVGLALVTVGVLTSRSESDSAQDG